MKVITSAIPQQSHGIRVWPELPAGDTDTGEPYSFACNLLHLSDTHCEVAQAIGDLNNDIAIAIGLQAIKLGYRKLSFHRSMGGLATRWATLTRRANGMDFYTVDLRKAQTIYEGRA